jgi:hypothetical protein
VRLFDTVWLWADANPRQRNRIAGPGVDHPHFLRRGEMIPVTSNTRIAVAVEPVDLSNGIDGLARICKQVLQADPFSGWLFLFRSRRGSFPQTGNISTVIRSATWKHSSIPGGSAAPATRLPIGACSD